MKNAFPDRHFIPFQQPVATAALPARFTFPFYHEPHPLCVTAAQELQQRLLQAGWDETFGIAYEKKGLIIGKMFGVLVVRTAAGETGYLVAFSGKLTTESSIAFVPPVVDLATEAQFFLEGEQQLNTINREVAALEQAPALQQLRSELTTQTALATQELEACKAQIRAGKASRKERRVVGIATLSTPAYAELEENLRKESLNEQYYFKDLSRSWKQRLQTLQQQLDTHLAEIDLLKAKRRNQSSGLQQQLFERYTFLNRSGATKSLLELFRNTATAQPPSGAGECTAPKLLQYAFKNGLEPLAMAEFWWGRSPGSEIRRHGQFYPACRGKCEPILAHMLEGMDVDENPLLASLAAEKTIETVYEDDELLVVNKPAEFLSVPGNTVTDSVYTRIQARYPEATGPLIVHRLDMSTSGLLVVAKTKEAHAHLQRQFLQRTVKKRYVALLDGMPEQNGGTINLPLRVDLDDRPRQLVCAEHGKPAVTHWEVAERTATQTRVYFYPVTGRTHQLRVHAAHVLGLNSPISGDDLYGTKAERLFLHAERLEFRHPVTGEQLVIEAAAPF